MDWSNDGRQVQLCEQRVLLHGVGERARTSEVNANVIRAGVGNRERVLERVELHKRILDAATSSGGDVTVAKTSVGGPIDAGAFGLE
jgi:hypothetical protein